MMPDDPSALNKERNRSASQDALGSNVQRGPVVDKSVRSPHGVGSRGLMFGLAALACIAFAIVWTAWPVIKERLQTNGHGPDVTPNSRVLEPNEIASRARRATVQIRAYDADDALEGEGSGFFVSADGVIVTNLHVLDDATSLQVETLSGEIYDVVYFVIADPRRDIAVLKVPVDDAYPLPFEVDSGPAVGERIYVMGNPLGQTGTFSDGLVSARRIVDGVTLVQISAPVSPGSSGGPVMNSLGNVVGIAALMLEGGQNLNYAVPVRYVRPLVHTSAQAQRYARHLLPSANSGLATVSGTGQENRGNTSRGRAGTDIVGSQFVTSDSIVRSLGGEPVSEIVRGALNDGSSGQHPVVLVAGGEYAISGYCDEDCTDLDLAIYTAAGVLLDSDTEYDDFPWLRFTAPASGSYRLTVSMVACHIEPCAYGVRLYRLSGG